MTWRKPVKFYDERDVLKPRICSQCNNINSPMHDWCGKCGSPLTKKGWEGYEEQQKEIQYIKDLQFLDKYFPELTIPELKKKRKKNPNQKIARCIRCMNLSETVIDGVIVDYCPTCDAPFSEKTIMREHWLHTHPDEAKEELKVKRERLREILNKRLEEQKSPVTKQDENQRNEIIQFFIDDPTLILDALKEMRTKKGGSQF